MINSKISFWIFSFFISFSFTGNACEIETYPEIYKIKKELSQALIINSNCSNTEKRTFLSIIAASSGKLPEVILKERLKEQLNKDITIKPKTIFVSSLADFINENMELQNNRKLFKLKSITGASAIYGRNIRLSSECAQCHKLGEVSIKVKKGDKQFWFSAIIKEPRKVWVATKTILPFQNNLSKKLFSSKMTYFTDKKTPFTDFQNINFYRFNRKINKGDIIFNNNLSPVKLIQYGQKVKLKIKGQGIKLQSFGISKSSGFINQYIELRNPKTKKTYNAKVIDYNQVEINI